MLNQVTTKFIEGSFQLTLALGKFCFILTWTFSLYEQYLFCPFIKEFCCLYFTEQEIAGHIHAQIGSYYFGMAMNDMPLLTSPLLLNQHQLHIL